MRYLGFLVNPVAGMGGSVGLKGTDGMAEEARRRGAVPLARRLAARALERLLPLREELVVLCAASMGAEEVQALGFAAQVVYVPPDRGRTTALDTRAAALAMGEAELLLFAGGDGTARDLLQALGGERTALGIPVGVKMHSPVYAVSPAAAGALALACLRRGITPVQAEVVDLDEDACRRGIVREKLYGYLQVPRARGLRQEKKAPTPLSQRQQQRSIALEMAERMRPGVFYLAGPGSTVQALFECLSLPKTLLGFDLIRDKALVKADVCEREALAFAGQGPMELILTPTGGQGFLLGRGNQQCSPALLSEIGAGGLHVLATREKLAALGGRPLLVDTPDPETNRRLSGYCRVITGWREEQMCPVAAADGDTPPDEEDEL